MSDLVGNTEDRFSHKEAHIMEATKLSSFYQGMIKIYDLKKKKFACFVMHWLVCMYCMRQKKCVFL